MRFEGDKVSFHEMVTVVGGTFLLSPLPLSPPPFLFKMKMLATPTAVTTRVSPQKSNKRPLFVFTHVLTLMGIMRLCGLLGPEMERHVKQRRLTSWEGRRE